MVAVQPDWDLALWQSWAQQYSSTGRSHPVKIYISCQMIHIVRYIFVYQPTFSRDCSVFSHNISLTEILGQTTK